VSKSHSEEYTVFFVPQVFPSPSFTSFSIKKIVLFVINFYFGFTNAGSEIKEDKMGWACGTYGEVERCVLCLMGKPEGRRLIGRYKSRWEDNIKKDLKGRGWKGRLVD